MCIRDRYKVVACNGQVRTIAHLNDVNLETWEPKYTLVAEHRAAIQRIISAAKQAEEVIIGTDADSMGENIGWHCCVVLGLNPTQIKRIKFSEISRGAIAAAIAAPTTLDMRVVMAQQARQIIDIVIGYTISPLLWARFPHEREGLSAGRCQTPALRIVNDNQRLFSSRVAGTEMHYVVSGSFAFLHPEYPEKGLPLAFELDGDIADLDATRQFLDASRSFCHQFSRDDPTTATVAPPPPLTTSTLLQLASTELQSSPKDTMKSAQMLYEGGYITYMRTEGTTYSAEFYAAHKVDNPNATDETQAHEAIRPTDLSVKEAGATTKDKRIYALIRQRCIESLGDPAQVTNMTVYVSAPHGRRYRATKQRVDVAGWMGASPSSDAGFVSNTRIFNFLETIDAPTVPYLRLMARQTPVHRPLHLTEAGLVEQLEKRGIGRPSTFASLTNKIVERNYVARQDIQGQDVECTDLSLENDLVTQLTHKRVMGSERRKLVITPLGATVATFLEQRFAALFDYEYTKHMEKELDRIERGAVEWSAVCSAFYFGLQQSINSVVEDTDVVPIVVETKTSAAHRGRLLGRWSDQDLYLCRGKYGLMAAWGDQTASLKCFGNRPIENISYEDVVDVLNTETTVRELSPNLSIRQGKYGPYIYFRTPKMRKPQFYQLKEYKETYMTCDEVVLNRWILETYGVH
jgi:DNA topoisomerase-1